MKDNGTFGRRGIDILEDGSDGSVAERCMEGACEGAGKLAREEV